MTDTSRCATIRLNNIIYCDSINIDVKQIRLSKGPWQSFQIDYKGMSGQVEVEERRKAETTERKTYKTSNRSSSKTAIQVLDKLIEINWFVLLFTVFSFPLSPTLLVNNEFSFFFSVVVFYLRAFLFMCVLLSHIYAQNVNKTHARIFIYSKQ